MTENKDKQIELLKSDIKKFNLWRDAHGIQEVDLSGADLFEANLSKANLSKANLSKANLFGANLSEANLNNANLREVDLEKANLRKANFNNANLREADLRKTNMTKTDLRGAKLDDADLTNANLHGAIGVIAVPFRNHTLIRTSQGLYKIGCIELPYKQTIQHCKAFYDEKRGQTHVAIIEIMEKAWEHEKLTYFE